jgi:hypothetical protein
MVLTALLLSLPIDGRAASIEDHKVTTDQVLEQMGWRSAAAITRVTDCNVATDFARLSVMSRGAMMLLFPTASDQIPAVRDLAETAPFSPRASVGFHFNSLYSFDAIEIRWRDLGAWVDETAARLASADDGTLDTQTCLTLLGILTHTVQDFYSHANWTGILNEYTAGDFEADEFPLFEELVWDEGGWREAHPDFPWQQALEHLHRSNVFVSATEDEGGLQTGSTRWETFTGTEPWSHRHKHGKEHDAIGHLSERATRLWVERVERQLPSLPWTYTVSIAEDVAPVPRDANRAPVSRDANRAPASGDPTGS